MMLKMSLNIIASYTLVFFFLLPFFCFVIYGAMRLISVSALPFPEINCQSNRVGGTVTSFLGFSVEKVWASVGGILLFVRLTRQFFRYLFHENWKHERHHFLCVRGFLRKKLWHTSCWEQQTPWSFWRLNHFNVKTAGSWEWQNRHLFIWKCHKTAHWGHLSSPCPECWGKVAMQWRTDVRRVKG